MANISRSYDPWGYLKKARKLVERNRRIVRDYLEGDSMATVAKKHGICAMAVCSILKRAGISQKDRRR